VAGLSAAEIDGIGSIGGSETAGVVARTAMAGLVGGVSASLMGGDFNVGFRTAAFNRLFNHEAGKLFGPPSSKALKQADEAAFGMRPDNPQDFEDLGDALSTAALAPALAPAAGPLGILSHLFAAHLKGDEITSSLVIDALSMYATRVAKYIGFGDGAAGTIGYTTGEIGKINPNEKK